MQRPRQATSGKLLCETLRTLRMRAGTKALCLGCSRQDTQHSGGSWHPGNALQCPACRGPWSCGQARGQHQQRILWRHNLGTQRSATRVCGPEFWKSPSCVFVGLGPLIANWSIGRGRYPFQKQRPNYSIPVLLTYSREAQLALVIPPVVECRRFRSWRMQRLHPGRKQGLKKFRQRWAV